MSTAVAEAALDLLETGWDGLMDARHGRPVDPTPRDHLWASRLSHCTRKMALGLRHPEEDVLPVHAYERVDRGKRLETALTARLMQAGEHGGFQVQAQEEHFEIRDRGLKLVTGRIDGRLVFRGDDFPGGRLAAPYEIKSGRSVEDKRTLEDLASSVWTENHVYQLLMGCWKLGDPVGFLLLDASSGLVKIPVVVEQHLQEIDDLLARMREAVLARRGDPLPAPTRRKELCDVCPHYGKSCAPGIDYGPGVTVVTDRPELEEALDQRAASDEARKGYDKAHNAVRRMLKDDSFDKEFEALNVGRHVIRRRVRRDGVPLYDIETVGADDE